MIPEKSLFINRRQLLFKSRRRPTLTCFRVQTRRVLSNLYLYMSADKKENLDSDMMVIYQRSLATCFAWPCPLVCKERSKNGAPVYYAWLASMFILNFKMLIFESFIQFYWYLSRVWQVIISCYNYYWVLL